MKKILKTILLIYLLAPIWVYGQGIHFEQADSFKQVLDKAKATHKYIFIDCYASWCGPCKQMEQTVYPQKAVGDVYNAQFICLKVQMDKTNDDNDQVKSWYGEAISLAKNFAVNAYPTFLFLDPEGHPVHKYVGSLDSGAFIKLAADAKNPQKQYYTLLRNFKPGQVDTAEERSLAGRFAYTDPDFAAKLTTDYLSRVPEKTYNELSKQKLMYYMRTDHRVQKIISKYLSSVDIASFISNDINFEFIRSIRDLRTVQQAVEGYILKFRREDWSKEKNVRLINNFTSDSLISRQLKNYISGLTDDVLWSKANLEYLEAITNTSSDRGFSFFYNNGNKADQILKANGTADWMVENILEYENLIPYINYSKRYEKTPEFSKIRETVAKKYNDLWATRIDFDAKLAWFSYLAREKKIQQYWPQYASARIAKVNYYRTDTVKSMAHGLNNICWEIFVHDENKAQLDTVGQWIKKIATDRPEGNTMDTYACLTYKAGHTAEAIDWENKALNYYKAKKNDEEIAYTGRTIKKMKNNEAIWLEKDYQE